MSDLSQRLRVLAHCLPEQSSAFIEAADEIEHVMGANDELDRKLQEVEAQRDAALKQVERAKAALAPFAKMASAMYVSGHCGGASPEDWSNKWTIRVEGFDGKHFHTPQSFGGMLTVADFRRSVLIDEHSQPASALKTAQGEQK